MEIDKSQVRRNYQRFRGIIPKIKWSKRLDSHEGNAMRKENASLVRGRTIFLIKIHDLQFLLVSLFARNVIINDFFDVDVIPRETM